MTSLKRKGSKKLGGGGRDFSILLSLAFCTSLGFLRSGDKKNIFILDINNNNRGSECLCSFFLELSRGNYLFCFFTLQTANGLQPGLNPTLLCPAVISVSLKEKRFSGMLCVHRPVGLSRPHPLSR